MKEQRDPIQEQYGLTDGNQQSQYKRFGNYDLVRRIDVGGMGEVYLARQRTAFGREVAVKIIRSDLAYDTTARKRFLREAEVSAHLKHDHILPLIEFSEVEGRLFLVTPYIKGGTLARRLHQGPMPLMEVYQLFSALVQAVAYIHKRGVIHRDLKPSNILLDEQEDDGQLYVRLIDFGIASIPGSSASPPLTTAGHEMGTVAYMAPERLDGVAAASNDIYSLGVILHQMLTGKLPSETNDVPLPQSLSYIVRRSLVHDTTERFASADELLKAFEYAYQSLSTSWRSIPNTGPRHPSPYLSQPLSPLPSAPGNMDAADRVGSPPLRGPQVIPEGRATTPGPAAQAQTPTHHPLSSEFPTGEVVWQEQIYVHRAEISAPPLPLPRSGPAFRGEDYDAPTSFMDDPPSGPQGAHKALADEALITGQPFLQNDQIGYSRPKGPQKRKRSLIGFISVAIVTLLVLISATSYMVFLSAITATIMVSPKVTTISKVLTVTANPNQHAVDATTATIPAIPLTSSQTLSQDGQTTGRTHCFLGIFNCQRAVSPVDVLILTEQIKPGLEQQIAQDLQRQEQAAGITAVGSVQYGDPSPSANPDVGTVSKTVTVSVSEQGSVEGIKMSDARNLAALLLKQHLDANNELMPEQTHIGQPVVQGVDGNGNVKIAIPVAGMEKYVISPTQIATMQKQIVGMKLPQARSALANLSYLNAADPVIIRLSYGDSIPSNVQQITITVAAPTKLPAVQLPTVPSQ
ncbi:MAG TPA: protein kinase [Ktedonosporobacter sp.]|nr:protein kinase [Ktedonosporobacter sp.]